MHAVRAREGAEWNAHAPATCAERRLDDRAGTVRQGKIEVVAETVVVLFQSFRPPGDPERQPHRREARAHWSDLAAPDDARAVLMRARRANV